MKRERIVALLALAVPFSGVAFAGFQYVDGMRATAGPMRRPAAVAIRQRPVAALARAVPKLARAVAVAPAPRVAVEPDRVVTPPTTCAGVVASIVWPQGWRVQCSGPRAGLLGVTQPGGITDLFVRADETMSKLRVVALHEAGHAWDLARLDPPGIARWCAARGCDPERFFDGAVSSEGWAEPSGAEDWASAWDACHGGEYHRSYMGFGPPTPSQCGLQNTLVGYPR
jgi:hypothetical protein